MLYQNLLLLILRENQIASNQVATIHVPFFSIEETTIHVPVFSQIDTNLWLSG